MFHFNNHAPSLTLAGPPSYWHPLPLPLEKSLWSLPDQHPADEDRVPRVPGAGGDCTALTGHQVPDRPRGLHTGQVTAQEGIGQRVGELVGGGTMVGKGRLVCDYSGTPL